MLPLLHALLTSTLPHLPTECCRIWPILVLFVAAGSDTLLHFYHLPSIQSEGLNPISNLTVMPQPMRGLHVHKSQMSFQPMRYGYAYGFITDTPIGTRMTVRHEN